MTSNTSTGDVQYELQNTESLLDVKENEQISGKKREDFTYEEPARFQRNVGQIEDKLSKPNNWPLIMLIVLMIAVVALTVSRVLKMDLQKVQQKKEIFIISFLQNIQRMNNKIVFLPKLAPYMK